jgi:hypothetical protein
MFFNECYYCNTSQYKGSAINLANLSFKTGVRSLHSKQVQQVVLETLPKDKIAFEIFT